MKLKKLLKLISKDTKIRVIYDFDVLMYDPILIEPSDYPRHEDLPVDALSVDEDSGILYVYINSMGYYYNAETDKYEKSTVNVDNGDQDDS